MRMEIQTVHILASFKLLALIIIVLKLGIPCVAVQALFIHILCAKPLMTIDVIDKLHPTGFDYSFPFLFWNDCPSTFT